MRVKTVLPKKTALIGVSAFRLVLVGCGGTGSFLASHIARLLAGSTLAKGVSEVVFVDGDTVEGANIGRQLFSLGDLGQNKATVLATRYNRSYGLDIRYVPEYLADDNAYDLLKTTFKTPTLLLGCVDTAATRKKILTYTKRLAGERAALWWLDAGNGRLDGQLVLGSTRSVSKIRTGIGAYFVEYLPYPPLIYPELVDLAQDLEEPRSCAELLAAEVQSLNVNAYIAGLAAELLRRFLAGELTTNIVRFDLGSFTTVANPITDTWLENFLTEAPHEDHGAACSINTEVPA